MYKLINDLSGKAYMVLNLLDNAYIPFDENNTDYQAYLKWLDEGNTPLPADA
jgi:hypothetical protein